jgi:TRAP-type uncharacterized transport system substrate-binding protein
MKRLALATLAATGILAVSFTGAQAAQKFITIGTGGQTGV